MTKAKKEAILAGIIGATVSFIMSCAMNYFIVPFPETGIQNALNNGISGAISGFLSGFMGLFMYFKKLDQND